MYSNLRFELCLENTLMNYSFHLFLNSTNSQWHYLNAYILQMLIEVKKNKFLREGGLRRVRFVRKMILYVNCLRVSATCTWHELCCLEQNTSLYQISEDNNLRIIAFQLVQGGKEEQFKTLTVDRAIFSQPLSPTLLVIRTTHFLHGHQWNALSFWINFDDSVCFLLRLKK